MDVVVARSADGFEIGELDSTAAPTFTPATSLARTVADLERTSRPRWVWADTRATYSILQDADVRVERAIDVRLCHRILRHAAATAGSAVAQAPASMWDGQATDVDPGRQLTLLDDLLCAAPTFTDVVDEVRRQRQALADADDGQRLGLLLRAESAGALGAAEMHRIGLPWNRQIHDEHLVDQLGPRPTAGQRPAVLNALAAEIQSALGAPTLNPDSPAELLNALRRAGLDVRSTRQWELNNLDHPVTAPLLDYKRRSRLHSANGWTWLDTWVSGGRFHPDYIPGGVVTGRWATSGGGALQIPKTLRRAVVAEPGWRLVVADVAQLEPRMLAAMSADRAMVAACHGADLYQDLVDRGIVATRQQAKIGMLAALYGGTTGDAAEVMPRLRSAFPQALRLVDEAARAGERFERVRTWLGRTSPTPGDEWRDVQQRAYEADAGEGDVRRARSQGRSWGRFTRNFVVQGTAAEWALCWMAAIRRDLNRLGDQTHPELVYFLHDEIIVHTPASLAEDVATTMHEAARQATQLMFGDLPIEVPLNLDIVDCYADAK